MTKLSLCFDEYLPSNDDDRINDLIKSLLLTTIFVSNLLSWSFILKFLVGKWKRAVPNEIIHLKFDLSKELYLKFEHYLVLSKGGPKVWAVLLTVNLIAKYTKKLWLLWKFSFDETCWSLYKNCEKGWNFSAIYT